MNKVKIISLFLTGAILFSSCASTTLIASKPKGAKVYMNGEKVGETPYSYTDTKIVGSSTDIKLEKEGYEPFNTTLKRNEQADVGAIIGGLFVWIPFLWTMKYKSLHNYELTPLNQSEVITPTTPTSLTNTKSSKAERLRELKQLLDDKIITSEEFDAEKKKILAE